MKSLVIKSYFGHEIFRRIEMSISTVVRLRGFSPTLCAFNMMPTHLRDSLQRLVQRFVAAECRKADAEPRRVYGSPKRGRNGGVCGVEDRLVQILTTKPPRSFQTGGESLQILLIYSSEPTIVVVEDGYLQYEFPILEPFI